MLDKKYSIYEENKMRKMTLKAEKTFCGGPSDTLC